MRSTTSWTRALYSVEKWLSTTRTACLPVTQISERQKLTINSVSLPVLKEFYKFDIKDSHNLEKKRLKETRELSSVKIPLIDYRNLQHLLAYEKAFNQSVGFKNWSFRDRIVWEELTSDQFSQLLTDNLRQEPEVLSFHDKETDCLHLAFFFKSVPGRIFFKKWKAEGNVVPSYHTFLKMDEASRARKNYLHLSEDEVGEILEKRILAMPADNSQVDIRVASAFHRSLPRVVVNKRDVTLGISPSYEFDTHTLRDIVRRETSSSEDKTQNSKVDLVEDRVNETGISATTPREEEPSPHDEAADLLLEEQVQQLKTHMNSACELFINFDNNPRLLFETSLMRVDQ
jgi:hypothetical protein